MLKCVMQTCFWPSIRLLMKMLQIPEFVTSPFCGCCIIQDFVSLNGNVNKGNVGTSNAAYASLKEQNYLWLAFYLFNSNATCLLKNWQNVVSAISGYKISYIF